MTTRSAPFTASAGSAVTRSARASDDLACELAAAQDPCQRRADEADADQRHALEPRFAHADLRKSAIAATTARISSSVPMVMRRCSGKPYAAIWRVRMPRDLRNANAASALLGAAAKRTSTKF